MRWRVPVSSMLQRGSGKRSAIVAVTALGVSPQSDTGWGKLQHTLAKWLK